MGTGNLARMKRPPKGGETPIEGLATTEPYGGSIMVAERITPEPEIILPDPDHDLFVFLMMVELLAIQALVAQLVDDGVL
jgi:hypothetical protein